MVEQSIAVARDAPLNVFRRIGSNFPPFARGSSVETPRCRRDSGPSYYIGCRRLFSTASRLVGFSGYYYIVLIDHLNASRIDDPSIIDHSRNILCAT